MNYLFDLLQGLGIAIAAGVSPFLPLAVVATAALLKLSTSFENTPFDFLSSPVVIAIAVLLAVIAVASDRKLKSQVKTVLLPLASLAIGGFAAAASVADRSGTWWPAAIAGVLAAAFGLWASKPFIDRTSQRLPDSANRTLSATTALAAAVGALLALLWSPLAVLLLVALLWLAIGNRRQQSRKHAGLRVLR